MPVKEKRFIHFNIKKQMDFKTINMFPIREYLAGLNIYPAKKRDYYGMYHSPFRKDNDASMKVDYDKNLWIDFGSNEGGTLIDLVMRIENCSNGEAMKLMERQIPGSFSFHGNNTMKENAKHEPNIRVTGITTVSAPALLGYLSKRGIDAEIYEQYCKEIHYSVNDKPYYAVGFKNDNGGWILRNEHFKGCILTMGTTFIVAEKPETSKETCLLFEGFMDFLSYLTLKRERFSRHDTVVLNSVSNLAKVKNTLSEYRMVFAFPDNDEAGKHAVQTLRSFCMEVQDQSVHYANYKDLNEFLCKKVSQSVQPDRLVQSSDRVKHIPPVKKRGRGIR